MIKIGIIGYGSMGSMLVNSFIKSNALLPEEIIISTHTKEKLNILKEKWKDINVSENNNEAAKKAKYIFICVKPLEVRKIIDEIKDDLSDDSYIISIAGCVTIENIQNAADMKVTKIIPSLTSEVLEGITLICHNDKVEKEDKDFIEKIFNSISNVKIIQEENFEVAADLTSCAPGMIAAMFQNFVKSSLRHCSLSEEEAEEMVKSTLLGTAKLLCENNMKFEEVITRVATKGGITEEGVKVLNKKLPDVFNEVFEKTLAKHNSVKEITKKIFLEKI